ncbi:MAG TPA: hypothetical protein ENI53_01130 [Thermoplasmatales archaeon]|nr:hypothetical protein [Thermoplasmatales archaeon]
MQKVFAFLIVLLLFTPFINGKEERKETSSNFSFIFSTNGTGYSIPAGLKIIFSRNFVLWYYENGSTVSYAPSFEIEGKQFGIGIIFFGVWKSPGIFQQPGYITGMGIGLVFIFQSNESYTGGVSFDFEKHSFSQLFSPIYLYNK